VYNGAGSVSITNSTFSGNIAASQGGAIFNFTGNSADTMTIVNCTLSGNQAKTLNTGAGGGGIYNFSNNKCSVGNSIIVGNTTASAGPDVLGPFTSLTHNVIGNNSGSTGFSNGVNNDQVGVTMAQLKLDTLKNNGGPTDTRALLSGSPAINAANTAPATDQRGFLRSGAPDIGAFEFNGQGVFNVSVNPSSSASGALGPHTLTATYRHVNGAANIVDARILISASGAGNDALYGRYDRATNKLYLANNTVSGFSGGFAPGSNNTIINSQGSLNCAATGVSFVGNNLLITWNFTPAASFTGSKGLFLFVRDAVHSDGWDRLGTWNITSDPSNLSLSPTTSTSGALGPRTFTTVYVDPNGATDIADARLLISADGDGVNDLYARYDRVNNKLYLMNNAGTGFMGPVTPGSGPPLSNSQGSLNCAATTVSVVGNTLTINWSFTPSASFIGTKNIFLYVRDNGGLQDGFDRFGSWIITSGPSNLSVTPASGSSAAGTARTLTTRYVDPNGATNIVDARILISPNGSGTNALYGRYDCVNKKLYLMNSTGTAFLGGYAPGSNNVISNSQGSLNCAATTVSQVGNVLTINWRFTPTAFAGLKNIFLFVRDAGGLQDGFDTLGTWTVTSSSSPSSVTTASSDTSDVQLSSAAASASPERDLEFYGCARRGDGRGCGALCRRGQRLRSRGVSRVL
ncbi:MAG: hypothetical protein M3347_18830, partial [Armatimonadota bacterium]|nr:hypothetical protein [Armatimonadota bacterium]